MANNFFRLAKAVVGLGAQKGAKALNHLDAMAARAADKLESDIASGTTAVKGESKPVSDPDAGKASQ